MDYLAKWRIVGTVYGRHYKPAILEYVTQATLYCFNVLGELNFNSSLFTRTELHIQTLESRIAMEPKNYAISTGIVDEDSNNHQKPLVCGLVMPISAMGQYSQEHWTEMREILSECVGSISEFKFVVKMVSDADDVGVIQRTIVQNLYNSDIVICDVSGKNPNVMFELGMRLAFDKPSVIIKDDTTDYTFDTGIIEHLTYPRDHRFAKMRVFASNLKEKVLATYKASLNNPSHSIFLKNFGNFVTPSLTQSHNTDESTVMALLKIIIQNQTKGTEQKPADLITNRNSEYAFNNTSIERGDFINFYQPIIDSSRNFVGLETLIRKKNDGTELQFPEETGLIVELHAWVIRKVTSDLKAWAHEGITIPRISIHLPWLNLNHDAIYRELASLVESAHGKIEVEIMETALTKDSEDALALLNKLKGLGLSITVNEFGTGYSSLAYLKLLPINRIKIDKSFICNLTTDGNDFAITKTIIQLSHGLRIKVIAEGVETEEQAETLKLLDCDEMQGLLFGEPIPADKLQELLINIS